MEKPLLSVIIPAYNIEAYLPRTLDSVLAQTYENLELIVVNDGSQDLTGQILDEYAAGNPKIKVIHQKNGGVTEARLRGVLEANGAWIGFVDGDDTIDPDMYQLLMENAITYQADISHCGYQMEFPSRQVLYHGTAVLRQQDRQQGLADLLTGNLVEPGLVTKIYKKELLLKMIRENVLDRSIKINEDLLMNFFLFQFAERSVFQDVCKYHYVVRADSAANAKTNPNLLYDPLKVTKILMEHTESNPQLYQIVARHRLHQLISRATMDTKKDPQLLKPAQKQARREIREMVCTGKVRSCSKKAKIMAYWTALWPASYGLVHRTYEKLTGLDKIYEIK